VTQSLNIDNAIRLSEEAGIGLREVSTAWTAIQEVAYMTSPMTNSLKSEIAKLAGLRYWSADGTPHNPPEEGFVDDDKKVAISFPSRAAVSA
jgi:hypothetical protein